METEHTTKVTIGKLTTKAGLREEMARIYRDMRRGTLPASDGAKLAFVLMSINKLLEPDGFLDLSFLQGDRTNSINKEEEKSGKAHERL